MNTQAHQSTDGTKRCSTSCLLRSRSDIVCVSPKNFDIYSIECEYMMYTENAKTRKRHENDDMLWMQRCTKARMAGINAPYLACLGHTLTSYTWHPRILRYVSLCIVYGECKNTWTSRKWRYIVNAEVHKGADGRNQCATSHLPRPYCNIIYVTPKNIEKCVVAHRIQRMRTHVSITKMAIYCECRGAQRWGWQESTRHISLA
jgi:hypothetical protein